MRKLVAIGALGTLLVGCGFSSGELGVGDALKLGVHRGHSGHVAVDVRVGGASCRVTRMAVSWNGGVARVAAC